MARAAQQISADAEITAEPAHPWVGRGGLKLDHALGLWPVAVRGAVVLVEGELDSKELRRALGPAGADAVFASRVLHHAPQPGKVVAQLASLCAPGGALLVIDYAHHDDESMRDQADAWLGFEPAELRRFARAAGLEDARFTKIPSPFCGDGPDRHLPWQVMSARKPEKGRHGHG